MIMENQMEWENVYNSNTTFHKNDFPSELIIQFVRRNFTTRIPVENRFDFKALDIGCGWGNNLKFVRNEGFDAFGIDFSSSAIKFLNEFFGNNVCVGNATNLPYPDDFFDFCFDKSSIQHNPREEIFIIHKEVFRVLKKNGKFFSVMLAEGTNGFLTGFLNENELRESLSCFGNFCIDYISRTENGGRDKYKSFIIEAQK